MLHGEKQSVFEISLPNESDARVNIEIYMQISLCRYIF